MLHSNINFKDNFRKKFRINIWKFDLTHSKPTIKSPQTLNYPFIKKLNFTISEMFNHVIFHWALSGLMAGGENCRTVIPLFTCKLSLNEFYQGHRSFEVIPWALDPSQRPRQSVKVEFQRRSNKFPPHHTLLTRINLFLRVL